MDKPATFQPVYTAILNLTEVPSIKRLEEESFKPDFVDELPKEETQLTITKNSKRDLPTSESATILINSMNNSRMLNSQKISQLTNHRPNGAQSSPSSQPSRTQSDQASNVQSNKQANQTSDGDMLKFEDELDVQPHSFSIASRLNANSTKQPVESAASNETNTTTGKPDEEESTGKKMKKKQLQMLQLKKKLKHNPEKFKAIKIRAPRLHIGNSTTSKLFGDKRRHKIGYASLVRTRNVNLTDYHLDDGHFIKVSMNSIDF